MRCRFLAAAAILLALIAFSASQTQPPVSHPAGEVTAGEFADAEYTFPGGLKVGSAGTSEVKFDVTGYSRLGVIKVGESPSQIYGLIDYGGGAPNHNKFIIYAKDNGQILSLGANNHYDQLVINADGNVGVGTTSPDLAGDSSNARVLSVGDGTKARSNLELVGSRSTTGSSGRILFWNSNNLVSQIESEIVSADGENSGELSLSTAYAGSMSEVMRITNDGKVGVGTTSPAERLSVEAPAGTPPLGVYQANAYSSTPTLINFYASSPSVHVGELGVYSSNGDVRLHAYEGLALVAGNAAGVGNLGVYVTPSGNVGIGTTDPGARLTVRIPNGNEEAMLNLVREGFEGTQLFSVYGLGDLYAGATQITQKLGHQTEALTVASADYRWPAALFKGAPGQTADILVVRGSGGADYFTVQGDGEVAVNSLGGTEGAAVCARSDGTLYAAADGACP